MYVRIASSEAWSLDGGILPTELRAAAFSERSGVTAVSLGTAVALSAWPGEDALVAPPSVPQSRPRGDDENVSLVGET